MTQQACESMLVSLQDILENKVTSIYAVIGQVAMDCRTSRPSVVEQMKWRGLEWTRKEWLVHSVLSLN